MRYRFLGRTGLKISDLCLGTMNFGDVTDEKESCMIMDKAIDAGINFLIRQMFMEDYNGQKFLGDMAFLKKL